MIFKEVVKDQWINMENITSIVIGSMKLVMDGSDETWSFPLDKLKDTPEHWRNWLRERS